MEHSVHITDCALVTGLGVGVDHVWSQLLAGKTAIRDVERFSTKNYITNLAATVPDLRAAAAGQSRLYPLLEMLLAQLAEVPAQARLITATTKGAIDLLEMQCRQPDSAGKVPEQVQLGTVPSWVAHKLRLQDCGINVNAACTSSTLAIARGAALIAHGGAEVVVVVCADLVSEFVFSGFSALQALAVEASRPFDCQRSGLTLGEGAAALVLMSAEAAQRYGCKKLAQVRGWGAANDANHITAPARDGCGLIQTIKQAVAQAQIELDDVAAISAHGTGTIYNDMMEITAFRAVFGERQLPLSSIKGALGHTLGAAGGIEAVLALKSLDTGIVPPTCGLLSPEQLIAKQVSSDKQTFCGDMLLSTNSGFGGVNAALVLQRGEQC
ncbi:MAG: beta-ketoacyl-[acyl-carrier-protein] synthase family protein [Desulfuromonas sp.]|nr:beta-ketoacyl-[acyl-carrier-protein] synthase family protein [Desulfuromonas sp.]